MHRHCPGDGDVEPGGSRKTSLAYDVVAATSEKLRVAVVCPGAARIPRGYETFAAELYRTLSDRSDVDVVLLADSKRTSRGHQRVPSLRREWRVTRLIGRATRLHAHTIEHLTFGLTSLLWLATTRPDVIIVSERPVAAVYRRVRDFLRGRWAIVVSNGSSWMPPYGSIDVVQQLTEPFYADALAAGASASQTRLVPLGFELSNSAQPVDPQEARQQLGLDEGAHIVLTVGSLDRSVKRIDWIAREVATLPDVELLAVGAHHPETEDLLAELGRLLPGRFHTMTVPPDQVHLAYAAADVFVLASQRESFGRVIIEALDSGVPTIVHNSPSIAWVAGPEATVIDMSAEGALAEAIARAITSGRSSGSERRRRSARERFDWASLVDDYVAMFVAAREGRTAARGRQSANGPQNAGSPQQ